MSRSVPVALSPAPPLANSHPNSTLYVGPYIDLSLVFRRKSGDRLGVLVVADTEPPGPDLLVFVDGEEIVSNL